MNKASSENFLTFSKPFIDAIKNVFTTMTSSELKAHSPQLRKSGEKAKGDISVVIGLNGSVKTGGLLQPFIGMMVLSFDTPVFLKIASAMLGGNFKEFNDEIKDVGSEISNITTGNAKKVLSEMGYKIDMSIPSTITGNSHEIQYPVDSQTVVITFDSIHGTFFMELCYQDRDEE